MSTASQPPHTHHFGPDADKRLAKRYRAERRFQIYGLVAIFLAIAGLAWLLITVVSSGYTAFWTHEVEAEIMLDPEIIDPDGTGDPAVIRRADYRMLLVNSFVNRFPDVRAEIEETEALLARLQERAEEARADVQVFTDRLDTLATDILGLVQIPAAADELEEFILDDVDAIGEVVELTVPASEATARYVTSEGVEASGLTERQRRILDGLLRAETNGAVTVMDSGAAFITLMVELEEQTIDPRGRREEDEIQLARFDWILAGALAGYSLADAGEFLTLVNRRQQQIDSGSNVRSSVRRIRREGFRLNEEVLGIVSESGAAQTVRTFAAANPERIGESVTLTLPVSDDVDQYLKGKVETDVPEALRTVSDREIQWVRGLQDTGELKTVANTRFFSNPDSEDPRLAGILSALAGSALALVVTLLLSVPIGVAAAIYLEEFAPRNRFTDFIEVNINNLAAVPSIVFGLLGLAVFIQFFGLPLSAPLVGGLVLTLMTLPTVIIATRAALKAVPPSIREGALGVGASPIQTVFHHVLPLAMPGILTGSIIGMAQALGETAPLLMIGMVAFVTEVPTSFTEPAAALPVQIFLWSDRPERGFTELTSAAIIVLLIFMIIMNGTAILLRRWFERRW